MILPFGKVPCRVSLPHVVIQIEVLVEEAPPASRTLLAVCEFEVFLVEYLGQGREPFRVRVLVAIDDRRGDLLGHAFKERADFRETELSGGVAVGVSDVLIDYSVGLEVAAGVDDLCGRGLGIRDASVQQAPRCLRQDRSGPWFYARRQVAFHDEHVVKDFVRLRDSSMMEATRYPSSIRLAQSA